MSLPIKWYNSASEYVRELIRDARERTSREAELKELVQLGLEQLRQGESLELDDASLGAFFDQAKARAEEERKLAEQRAQVEAIAKARAEAERKRAQKEAEAKARREAQRKEFEEEERRLAEARARLEAEAKARAERDQKKQR